jgi:hypothetical protein
MRTRNRKRDYREWWRQTWPQAAHMLGWGTVAYFLGDTAIGGHPDGLLLTAAALLIAVQAARKRGDDS